MKTRAGAILSSIWIDRSLDRKISVQLYMGLRDIILSGGLKGGERLPATRTLASETGVSRTTVIDAVSRLVAEGLLESRIGAGTFVSQTMIDRIPERPPASLDNDARLPRAFSFNQSSRPAIRRAAAGCPTNRKHLSQPYRRSSRFRPHNGHASPRVTGVRTGTIPWAMEILTVCHDCDRPSRLTSMRVVVSSARSRADLHRQWCTTCIFSNRQYLAQTRRKGLGLKIPVRLAHATHLSPMAQTWCR